MTDTQGTCGSYDMTALPNLFSIPLIKPKQTAPENLNYFSEKEGRELGYDDQMTSACVPEGTWDFDETFHGAADKQQLSRHAKQTVEHINLFSSATILQTCQPILTALNANKNHQHVLLFARKLYYHLYTKFFFTGNWSNNSLQKAINQLNVDRKLSFFWKKIITKHLNSRVTNQALKSGSFCFCKKIHKKKVCKLFS